jgi:hypothetical protein
MRLNLYNIDRELRGKTLRTEDAHVGSWAGLHGHVAQGRAMHTTQTSKSNSYNREGNVSNNFICLH